MIEIYLIENRGLLIDSYPIRLEPGKHLNFRRYIKLRCDIAFGDINVTGKFIVVDAAYG